MSAQLPQGLRFEWDEIADFLRDMLPNEDWGKPDMVDTPMRWAKMMAELGRQPEMNFNFTVFDNPGNDEMVLVRDVHFASLCAHHLLPFYGKCHLAYLPGKKIVGLSKIPRLVQHIAKGTWTQEALTSAIADKFEELLEPLGVAVVMPNIVHTCMSIRGVQERSATTTTSCMKGRFADHDRLARAEFFSLLSL
jgi:GTP cyclohydrolase I